MLHASIRSLNSLADLEVLQGFYEKYFGNTVENRNPTLIEVLHFEEEVLRQKIEWREKYETVICGWLSSKAIKDKLTSYHSKATLDGMDTNTINSKIENTDALNEANKNKAASNEAKESKPAPDEATQSEPTSNEAKKSDSAPNETKENQPAPSGDSENKSTEKTTASPPTTAVDGNASTAIVPNTEQHDTPAVSTT